MPELIEKLTQAHEKGALWPVVWALVLITLAARLPAVIREAGRWRNRRLEIKSEYDYRSKRRKDARSRQTERRHR